MSVMIVTEYRLLPGGKAKFLDLLRAERERAETLGGVLSAREVVSGGSSTGQIAVGIAFATALQRGEYVDRVAAESGLSSLDDAVIATHPCAALVTRYSANGIPASVPPEATLAPVVSQLLLRIAPGHHPDAEAAISEHRRDREDVGIQCEQWALISAGTDHGLRIFGTTASDFAELATQQDKVNAQSAARGRSVGAMTRAQQSGIVTVVESRSSRRIADS